MEEEINVTDTLDLNPNDAPHINRNATVYDYN